MAYKRFVDNVPQAVDRGLVRRLSEDIRETLFHAIVQDGSDARKRCRKLLREAPVVASKRDTLQKKLDRLEAAKKELMNVW